LHDISNVQKLSLITEFYNFRRRYFQMLPFKAISTWKVA
jgi:hypothetical protein